MIIILILWEAYFFNSKILSFIKIIIYKVFFKSFSNKKVIYAKTSIIYTAIFLLLIFPFTILTIKHVLYFFSIDYSIDSINKKSSYINFVKIQDKFIEFQDEENELDVFRFQLKKDNVLYNQPFEPMIYFRRSLDFKNEDQERLLSLYEIFNKINMSLPLSFFEEYILEKYKEYDKIRQTIMIISTVIAHLSTKAEKIYILVKGYSDTTSNEEWTMPLNLKYYYDDVSYYPTLDKLYTNYKIGPNYLETIKIPQKKNIPSGKYTNKDLPILRAKFVLENYIINFFQNSNDIKFESGILEGQVIDGKSEVMRNVEVYIAVKRNLFNQIAK
jgi:hypothetical protein